MGSSTFSDLFTYRNLVHAIAGATGSVVAMSAFYPLDTVRSRLQLEENRESKNTFTVMHELVREEGVYTLYRGIVPVLKSLCASNFVYFYTFHGLKALNRDKAAQSAGRDLFLASVAGVINVLTTTPLWVVNTRMKMAGIEQQNGQYVTNRKAYTGLIDGLIKISQDEGFLSLWNGTLPSLILVSNPAINFMVYESIKRQVDKFYPSHKLSSLTYFMMGAVSKAVACVLTYPLQLIQTKLRHGHNYKNLSKDAGMVEMTLYILKHYGAGGMFKGMEAKILQTVLTGALMFAAYEKIANFVFRLLLLQKAAALKK